MDNYNGTWNVSSVGCTNSMRFVKLHLFALNSPDLIKMLIIFLHNLIQKSKTKMNL